MIWMALLLCLLMILPGCQAPAQSKEDTLGKRCDEIVSLYQAQYDAAEKRAPESSREPAELSQQDIDAIEERLMELGLDVVDTSGDLPAYLTTGAAFRDFWSRVQQNRDARQEVLTIRPTGDLGYRLLEYQEGTAMVYSMVRSMEDGIVTDYEAHPVLDWALSDRGNFYYRIFPWETSICPTTSCSVWKSRMRRFLNCGRGTSRRAAILPPTCTSRTGRRRILPT